MPVFWILKLEIPKLETFPSIEQTNDMLLRHMLSWCIVSFFMFFSLCSTLMLRHVLLIPGFAVSPHPMSITKALTLESAVPFSLLYSLPACSNLNWSFPLYKLWKQTKPNQTKTTTTPKEDFRPWSSDGLLFSLVGCYGLIVSSLQFTLYIYFFVPQY